MKNLYILIGIATFILAIAYTDGKAKNEMNHSFDTETGWNQLIETIDCQISSNINHVNLSSKQFPVFSISLKYKGTDTYTIKWDDNFGRVLWEGDFLLISKSDDHQESTFKLKFLTSNTYPTGKTVKLNRGDELKSILDFKKLPARYAKNLFDHKGKVSFRLWINNQEKKQSLKPISNSLVLTIK